MAFLKDDNMTNETSVIEENNQLEKDEPRHLISELNFNKIIDVQQEIYEATDINVTIRKIVNSLITDDALDSVKNTFLTKLSAL
jgi:hypothetical protein